MRALTATMVMTFTISTACVGGPGAPPSPDDDTPGEIGGPGGGERPGRDDRDDDDDAPPSTIPPRGPTEPGACVADQCAPIECTCGETKVPVRACLENRCVTECGQVGCT